MSGIVGIGGGGGGTSTPTLRFSIQGLACASSIDNIVLVQDTGLSMNVLNSLGTNFETNCYVRDSDGNSFCMPNKNVLNSAGTPFTVA